MYEKILATVCTAAVTLGVIWLVCGRRSNRRGGDGTGSDARRVADDLNKAEENNNRLTDTEQRTRDAIERAREVSGRTSELIESAGRDNQDGQELVTKAKSILASARHTN